MNEKEFNLIEEPWIRVIDFDCNVSEVSLKHLFRNAHNYKDLSGELPTQDFAILRLLLAVLHTVFSRYDTDGNAASFEDEEDAVERWQELWKKGEFPYEVTDNYLEQVKESFWLFHPTRPFYQTEHATIGTEYSAPKLFGNLSESGNKIRLFPSVSGEEKQSMSFSEAARWLIYVNAYDDTAVKPSTEGKENAKKKGISFDSPGVGWLGKIGLISILGNNLFETLMLNLVFLNESKELFEKEKPIWEREIIPDAERVKIALPNNLSELYTLQSRRLFLKREDDKVTGYYLLGGDFFDRENAFVEPMTVWKNTEKKSADIYVPRRHNVSKQFWRDFSSLIMNEEKNRKPGVISWIDLLTEAEVLENRLLGLKIASVQYGDKDFFVNNVFSDSIEMYSSLISQMQSKWQTLVKDSVDFCEVISQKVWHLAKDVNLADGGDFVLKENNCSAKVAANRAKAEFYNLIDVPFRKWLCQINPETDQLFEKRSQWSGECVNYALKLGENIIKQASPSAIFGKGKKSAAKAWNDFIKGVRRIEKR